MTLETFQSVLWDEDESSVSPFQADACFCSGYDVYGEILPKASWAEYLYLIISGERPTREQVALLEGVAVALAHPGIRDPSVHAAMAAGVGGSSNAGCLMAALGVAAGRSGGGQEVARCVELWSNCGTNLERWAEELPFSLQPEEPARWPAADHPAGFEPYASQCSRPVQQILAELSERYFGGALAWLRKNQSKLEIVAGKPIAITGVAAAAFYDLSLSSDQAEMLYLILRLPGAAAHAIEQRKQGWKRFPFFHKGLKLTK